MNAACGVRPPLSVSPRPATPSPSVGGEPRPAADDHEFVGQRDPRQGPLRAAAQMNTRPASHAQGVIAGDSRSASR
jgi:hypothetical protein